MFSGIVQAVGEVAKDIDGDFKFYIRQKNIASSLKPSDSIAVNGVCLTVVEVKKDTFCTEVIRETRDLTNLYLQKKGDLVNLETSLKYGDPIGGHMVYGHVEGVGKISSLIPIENSVVLRIKTSDNIISNVVNKGYITVDGMSLTATSLNTSSFEVHLVPYTRANTISSGYKVGSTVNLESDISYKNSKRGDFI